MKDGTKRFLDRAARSIESAKSQLLSGDVDFAASRIYYAMFYTAEALLWENDLRARSHAGIHSLYGRHFAKTMTLDRKFHRWLMNAFDKRLLADSDAASVVTPSEVSEMIDQATEFLQEARRFLDKEGLQA